MLCYLTIYRVWPTRSFSCAIRSLVRKHVNLTSKSLRLSITAPWKLHANWPNNTDPMKPMPVSYFLKTCYQHFVLGSPVSKNILQFDMWNVTPTDMWDWNELRGRIAKHGVRNSLLMAPMPTASTAQILGNNEAFEPYTSNMYTRRVTKGDFQVSMWLIL